MSISIGEIIVWLIIGALAGTLAGRLITFTKRGFGFWVNTGVGMLGALVGGFLFRLFHIDLGLGEINFILFSHDVVLLLAGLCTKSSTPPASAVWSLNFLLEGFPRILFRHHRL